MNKIQKKWIALGVAAVAVVALGVILWKTLPSGKPVQGTNFKITPNQQDEQGVLLDSIFTIETDGKVTEESLRSALQIEPAFEYSLTSNGKQWNLTPTTPLSENMVYRFVVKDEAGKQSQSFAFQTKGDLMISQVYPKDKEDYVDTKTSIELMFNASDLQNIEEFVTIEPAIPGKWESNGYVITFVPDEPLSENTIYRITAKAGLTAANGLALKEDKTYSFTTDSGKNNDYYKLSLNGNYLETFLPGDVLAVEFNGDHLRHKDVAYQVNVHKYPDINALIDEVKKRDTFYKDYYGPKQEYQVDTSSLEEVYSVSNPLYPRGEYSRLYYALLPNDLPEGYYIVTLSGKDSQGVDQFVQKQIAIGNVSTYVQSTNGNTTVWLNDPATGTAKANTSFQLQDTTSGEILTGTTDEKGIGKVDTVEMKEGYLSVMDGDTPVSFQKVNLAAQEKAALSEKYFTALYTDREIYQPNDTIHYWGVLRPRGEATLPNKVTVTLGNQSYREGSIVAYQQEVDVGADGTFTGELKISGLSQSYYQLSVQDGSQPNFDENKWTNLNEYCSKGLSVSEFVKPAYAIEVTTDKEWYYMNEKITMNISAKYFDGTPVSGGRLELSGITQTELELDKEGKASYTFDYISTYGEDNRTWSPFSSYYYISSADQQDVTVSTSGSVLFVPSKIAAKMETSEDNSKLTVTTAQLDESKILEPGAATFRYGMGDQSFEHYAGAAVDIPIKVIVNKVEKVKTQTGTYYDPINKQIIPQYNTEIIDSVVEELTATTVNGVMVWENLPYVESDLVYYWYKVEFDNQLGGTVNVMGDPYKFYSSYGEETRYSFEDPETLYEERKRKVDAQVELGLYKNGTKEENKGAILYSILQKETLQLDATQEDSITFPFVEEYIPNIQVMGAYFDGRHVYEIETAQYHYDYSERTLNLDVATDAESYTPSSEATVSLTLTDKDGKPIAGSAVIGVVDEAIFAIQDQTLDLPSQLYQTVYSAPVARSASYKEYDLKADPNTGGDGMGGGGGGSAIRADFADTVTFQTVAIDASGKATVKVTLPDNITSWRITAAAISADNQAGSNTENTVVTLPYYIRPIITDQYLDGDDLTISVASIGTDLKSGDTAEYTAKLFAADGTMIQEQTASASVDTVGVIRFGKQPVGDYSIEITGVSNGKTDSMKETCSVIAEGLTSEFMKTMSIEELSKASSLRYPVQITAYDKRLKPYMEGLESLKGQSGQRTEFLVASYLSQMLYNQLLPEDQQVDVKKDIRLEKIQTDQGGIRQLPMGMDNIETTMKVLLTAPELVNKINAVNFLKKQQVEYSVTSDDRYLILAGLAAVDEPVLLDIKRVAAEDGLTNIQKLYLAAGLAKAGDSAGAKEIYDTVVTARTTKDNQIFYKAETEDETLATTAAALMATSLMNHPDADGLMMWVTEQNQTIPVGRSVLVNLEMISYLQAYPNSDTGRLVEESPAKFTYTANGETVTKELGQNGMLAVWLNAEDFGAGGFKASGGDVETILRYTDYVSATPSQESDKVSVTKTITPINGTDLQAGRRAKVEITMNFKEDAPSGCYDVEDYIPSGMRYVENMYNTPYQENVELSSSHEGQRVYGNVYWTNPKEIPSIGGGDIEPYNPEPIPYDEEAPVEPIPDTAKSVTIPVADDELVVESAPSETEAMNPASDNVIGLSQEEIEIRAAKAKPYTYTFVYYVSCTLPGEFVVEPAYISNESENIYAKASSEPVTIQE